MESAWPIGGSVEGSGGSPFQVMTALVASSWLSQAFGLEGSASHGPLGDQGCSGSSETDRGLQSTPLPEVSDSGGEKGKERQGDRVL